MESWAREPALAERVRFACVSVEGLGTAQMFGQMFGFSGVENYTLESGLSGFGQLGCSGFILLSADFKFITRKSEAYLQVGPEQAFGSFRRQLMALPVTPREAQGDDGRKRKVSDSADDASEAYKYEPGALAVVEGLTSAAAKTLNGKVVRVERFNTTTGRFEVEVMDTAGYNPTPTGKRVSIRPCCLAPPAPPAPANAVDGSSSPPPVSKTQSVNTGGGMSASVSKDREDQAVASVGVDVMDQEHEECEKALRKLEATGEVKDLQHFRSCLVEHFEHEEELMSEHGFGGSIQNPMSALTSHTNDHKRILNEVDEALQGHTKGGGGLLGTHEIERIVGSFSRHIETFDVLYHASIPADAS